MRSASTARLYLDFGRAIQCKSRRAAKLADGFRRAGRVLRTYGTDQVFWSWQFAQNGEAVAFCTGPFHGGADSCELHRIDSGRLLATWRAHAPGDPPAWVMGLRY